MMYDVMEIGCKKYDVMVNSLHNRVAFCKYTFVEISLVKAKQKQKQNRKFESDTYGTIY